MRGGGNNKISKYLNVHSVNSGEKEKKREREKERDKEREGWREKEKEIEESYKVSLMLE